MNTLNKFKKSVMSQWGEDGIIEEIFKRIGVGNKTCVEFGAWDGKYLSNTWNLWHEKKWSTVLIEGNKQKTKILKRKVDNFPEVIVYEAFIEAEGENSLDNILDKLNINKEIDLISIDIDGDDYYIFKSLIKHKPRVIIVEYNPTIPYEFNIVQKEGEYFGASAKALCKLAKEKDYKLATITDTNCIFVENKEFPKLQIKEPLLKDIFVKNHLSYIITSYDGKSFINKIPPYTNLETTKYNKTLPQFYSKHKLIPIYLKKNEPLFKIFMKSLKLKLGIKKIKEILPNKCTTYLKNKLIVIKWYLKNKPVPTPHIIKQKTIKNYAKKYKIKTLIETGTYLGEMINAMKNTFRNIYSIELDKTLYEKAIDKFKDNKHIKIINGDSGEKLPEILKDIDRPCLFWLDGHYSAGITAKGKLNTPIYKELEIIFSHKIKKHIILIDDARCFVGKDDYPTIEELKNFIENNNRKLKLSIKNDIIRIIC